MQLMLKPTLKCQFKCDFCSAAKYKQTDQYEVTTELINNIQKINPDNIIITGGDPLLLPPKYFYDLLSINEKITLSITTNLWDYKLNPTKWHNLFKNPRFEVCTSFQYGDKRKKPNGEPFSEKDFIEIEKKFYKNIGYTPEFISVISTENEKMALKHVLLAKKLNTKCKLNNMLPLGKSNEYYPRYKMLDIYFKIIDLNLDCFESNTESRSSGKCPINLNGLCFKLNRSIIYDSNKKYRFSYCEDLAFTDTFNYDLSKLSLKDKFSINETIAGKKCYTCELFAFCNGCKVHRMHAINDISYCYNMSKYIYKLKKYNFI